jgi:hypothetical protein
MKAGFIINWEKSSLIPTTNFTFLGMLWDSVEGALSFPQDKLQHLHSQAAFLLNNPAPTCRQVMVLTGLVAAFHKAVPLLRLKGRYVQLSLELLLFGGGSSKDCGSSPRGKARPPLDDAAPVVGLPHHLWPLTAEDCAIEVQMDASDRGYGVWFQGRLYSGKWDDIDIRIHILV